LGFVLWAQQYKVFFGPCIWGLEGFRLEKEFEPKSSGLEEMHNLNLVLSAS